VSVQPVHHDDDPRVTNIVPAIESIGPALSSAMRLQFYGQAMHARAGEEIDAVLQRGRFQALLDQSGQGTYPPAGRRVTLEELAAPIGGVETLDE
jgi:hypothetical protein